MNDQIAVGAFALVASISTVAVGSRWYVRPLGEQKPRARAVLDEASLEELLSEWPEPVHATAPAQEWRDCPRCDNAESCIRHWDGWLCGHCLLPLPAGLNTITTGDRS